MGSLSRKLRTFYRNHFEKKMFNKILFLYSMILTVTLAALSFFIYQYAKNELASKEAARQAGLLEAANAIIDRRMDATRLMIDSLYHNKSLLRNLTLLLENDYSKFLEKTLDLYMQNNQFGAMDMIVNAFRDYFSSGFDLDSIILLADNRPMYYITDQSLQMMQITNQQFDDPFKQDLFPSQGRLFPTPRWNEDLNKNLISITFELKHPDTLQIIGTMMFNFNVKGLKGISSLHAEGEGGGYLLVTTPSGEVLFDSSNRLYGHAAPVLQAKEEPNYEMLTSTANKAGVIVSSMVPAGEAQAGIRVLRQWIVLITLLCISGAVLLTFITMRKFSRRTQVIVRAIEKLNIGQRSVRIPLQEGDELYQISYNFNKMSERLNDSIEKVYVSEIKQKNAEIKALQMQINPHFLYNTLEAIRMNAVSQGIPEVGKMIYLLATLFRNSMRTGMFVEVEEEMIQCKLYLELFQIRYPQQLTIDLQIEDAATHQQMLKLSIQPLVENYVLHGFRANRSDNLLEIHVKIEDHELVIRIRDHGRGIAPERLVHLKQSLLMKEEIDGKSDSIGLKNVHSRLQMVYGSEYGLNIDSVLGVGTEIIMRLPLGTKEGTS